MRLPLFYDSWRCDAWRYEQDAQDIAIEEAREHAFEYLCAMEESDISDSEYTEMSQEFDACHTVRAYLEFCREA